MELDEAGGGGNLCVDGRPRAGEAGVALQLRPTGTASGLLIRWFDIGALALARFTFRSGRVLENARPAFVSHGEAAGTPQLQSPQNQQ